MTAFNLKDEREGGHFDESMNYIFHKVYLRPIACHTFIAPFDPYLKFALSSVGKR